MALQEPFCLLLGVYSIVNGDLRRSLGELGELVGSVGLTHNTPHSTCNIPLRSHNNLKILRCEQ